MKVAILHLAIAASLAAAQPHHHGHHHHQRRGGSQVEKRDVETAVTYVPAYVTKYVMGDQDVTPDEAKAGLDKGLYVVVGETTPTFTPPAPAASSATPSSQDGGLFIEQVTTSISSVPATTSSPSLPPTTSSSPTSSGSSGSSTNLPTGIDEDFPSGKVSCDHFPAEYGAVALDYLGFGGWSGLQDCPNFSFGDSFISFIETKIKGQRPSPGTFASYACPDGYVKSQWPQAQGSTGQSIGGLYCNEQGFLELSRPSSPKICIPGVGNIKIINNMSNNSAICRTDYPGTESMVIPLDAQPGGTFELANIESSDYYEWDGKPTTLQYYVNQPGLSVEEACLWDCLVDHDACGNWAPTIIGTGQSSDGITYLSLFPNKPTSSANLAFNIQIKGDITTECYVKNGQYAGSDSGCTTGVQLGGTAYLEFTDA